MFSVEKREEKREKKEKKKEKTNPKPTRKRSKNKIEGNNRIYERVERLLEHSTQNNCDGNNIDNGLWAATSRQMRNNSICFISMEFLRLADLNMFIENVWAWNSFAYNTHWGSTWVCMCVRMNMKRSFVKTFNTILSVFHFIQKSFRGKEREVAVGVCVCQHISVRMTIKKTERFSPWMKLFAAWNFDLKIHFWIISVEKKITGQNFIFNSLMTWSVALLYLYDHKTKQKKNTMRLNNILLLCEISIFQNFNGNATGTEWKENERTNELKRNKLESTKENKY